MPSRIVVPTDFSAQSDAALTYARLCGKTFDLSLHLLHVTNAHLKAPHNAGELANEQPAALKELHARVTRDDPWRHTTVRLVHGTDPAEHITHYADEANAALIVMGTHGRSGVSRLVMGSVAEKVVRTAPCPVFTVHGAPRSSFTGFRRILVATDFSAASDAALDSARFLASRFEASLHVLHVLPEIGIDGGLGSEVFITEAPEVRMLRLTNAREQLTHRISGSAWSSLRVTSEVIFGAPAETIVGYADDNHFDLIVMGTHGRKGMAHLLVGSVAERVVRLATCPVMTTRTAWRHVDSMLLEMEPVRAMA